MSRNGQLSLAQAVSSARAFQAEAGPSRTAETNPNRFKAPAHKHAHHLHSIPPREKSTRTLIIDHMLWVHARTRFAQARAELGMTDRTGGPSASNYTHRRRPENYEEEDEVGSDGEDVLVLKARHEPDDDHAQDLQLAQSLRLRAEGLEKVINSMLVQPPPVHLHFEEDFFVDPNQHMLPNGVRLRLALGTLVNDFFTRQAPPPPFRHKKFAAAGIAASPLATNTSDSSTASPGLLPPALNALVPISAYGQRKAEKRARKRLGSAQSFSSNLSPRTRSLYLAGADPETANSPPTFRCPRHLHTGCEICVEAKQDFSVKGTGGKGKARERSASTAPTPGSTFAAPSWPSTSSSNPSASSSTPNPSAPIGIAPDGGGISGFQDPSAAGGCSVGVGEGLLKPSLNGSVLRRRTAAPYTRRTRGGGGEVEADSTGSGYTKLSELLPRFLRLSALVLMELGREVYEGREGQDEREENEREERGENGSGGEGREDSTVTNSPNSPTMTKQGVGGRAMPDNYSYTYTLTPSREWYHLLAGILTRAALQGYLTAGWRGVNAVECLMGLGLGIDLQRFLPARTEDSSRTRGSDRAPSTTYSTGAPSTRAPSTTAFSTTEGNTGDDMDTRASSSSADEADAEAEAEQEPDMFTEDEDLYKEFNPDEMPSLHQAVAILFPSLGLGASLDDGGEGGDRGSGGEERGERGGAGRGDRDSGYGGDRGEGGQGGDKGGDKRQNRRERASPAEAEFMGEMSERLRKFMEIPDSTPDLSTHMEDLAWRYPAEPMERAAARFCEAIASWRGKPELEGYKKRPPKTWPSTSSPNGTRASFSIPMTMESLVHSNPVSPTIPTISRSQPQPPPQSPSQSQTQPASTQKPSIDVYFIHPDRDPSGYPVSLSSFYAGPSGRAAPPNQSQSHRISASPVLSSLSPYPTTNSRRQSFHSTPKSSSSPYSLPALSQSPRSANAYPHPNSNSNSNQTSFQRRTSSSPTSNPNPNPNPIPLLNHPHAHNQNQNQNQPSPSSSSAGGFSYYSGPQGNTSAMTSTMNSAMNSTPSPSSTSAMLQHQHQQQQQQQQQYAHSHSSHAIGAQQIPVWNAATGAWMPPPPPPTISGGKRMRFA